MALKQQQNIGIERKDAKGSYAHSSCRNSTVCPIQKIHAQPVRRRISIIEKKIMRVMRTVGKNQILNVPRTCIILSVYDNYFVLGQSRTREIGLITDNDLYTSSKNDKYYTNGLEIFLPIFSKE
jgi:hypothetical protein